MLLLSLLHCKVFAIDVVSHLSLHYALPKSLAVARLAISVMSTLLTGMYSVLVMVLFHLRSCAN